MTDTLESPDYKKLFQNERKCLVVQHMEAFEQVTGFETKNQYSCNFGNGESTLALEKSSFVSRCCCGAARPFDIRLVSKDGKDHILTYKRPFKWVGDHLKIHEGTGEGKLLGYIEKRWYWNYGKRWYYVYNANGEKIYEIQTSCENFLNFIFVIFQKEKGCCGKDEPVGVIKKKWGGYLQESKSDADNFAIHFPKHASPEDKAILFGAIFLIDFGYYENDTSKKKLEQEEALQMAEV